MEAFSKADIDKIKRIQKIFKIHGDNLFNRLEDKQNFFLTGGMFATLWHLPDQPGIDLKACFRLDFPDSDMDLYCKDKYNSKDVIGRAMGDNRLDYFTVDEEGRNYPHNYVLATVDCDKDKEGKLGIFAPRFIQFMFNPCGNPEDVIQTFDFEHSKIWYDFATNELHISPFQLWCIKNKRFLHNEKLSKNPVKRKEKMQKRGWKEYHPAIEEAVQRANNRNW